MPRRHDYPIIRFLIGAFYALAAGAFVLALVVAGYLVVLGEALRNGLVIEGPVSQALNRYNSTQLFVAAGATAAAGLVLFLLLGTLGQLLAIQRDGAVNAARQVRLLEDILELNEEVARASSKKRVALCEGCHRLGALERIESGQWICRECRRQIRIA